MDLLEVEDFLYKRGGVTYWRIVTFFGRPFPEECC